MFWLTAEMFKKQTTILFLVSYDGHLKILMFAAVGWTKHFYNITSVFMKLFWTFLIIDQLIGQHFNWCLQIYKHQDVHCHSGTHSYWFEHRLILNSICRLDVFVISASCYSWRCSRITKWKLTPDVSSDGSWFHFSLRQFLLLLVLWQHCLVFFI